MTRIELGGKGDPIPILALPDPSLMGELPSTVIEFKDGDLFDKQWWMNLGFTHFEVWCVGASGGRGGSIGRVVWPQLWSDPSDPSPPLYDPWNPPMPPDLWEMYKEREVLIWESGLKFEGYNGVWWYQNGPMINTPNWVYGQPSTDFWVHWADYLTPNRDPLNVVTYHSPYLEEESDIITPYGQPSEPRFPFGLGGGGGGGGTQVVRGALVALPDICPVVVGQAGADSGPGQMRVNGPWVTQKSDFMTFLQEPNWELGYAGWSGYQKRLNQLDRLIAVWQYRYPDSMPTFLPPQPGGDGGASSFGGNICRASGGQGGHSAMMWEGGVRKLDGAGGDGGVGGQLAVGGGAVGSKEDKPGADGTWINDIGKGGGGGRGGASTDWNAPTRNATSGGKGTMSYADISVHGKGELWSYWVRIDRRYSHYTGLVEYETPTITTSKYVPGGGGGVRALKKYPYGSRAAGYNPNGHVLIRLTKIS